jgi:hypothetical protein
VTIHRITLRTPRGDIKGRLDIPDELEATMTSCLAGILLELDGELVMSVEPPELTWPPCVWCGEPTGAGDHRACYDHIVPLTPGESFVCSTAWLDYMAALPDHDGMARFRVFRRLGTGDFVALSGGRVRAVWEPPAAELEALRLAQTAAGASDGPR